MISALNDHMLPLRNMEFTTSSISQGFFSSRNLFLILIVFISLLEHVSAATNNSGNETDRLALLQFKRQISDNSRGVINSWNDSLHHCQWHGVTCGARHKRVIAITLTRMNMYGSISPYLGNLSFLKSIELQDNIFHGEIPQEVGRLFRLRFLNFSENTLTGKIPVNLSRCLDLRAIDLNGNALKGKIPYELISLKKLSVLRLSVNNLTGSFPSFLGNLTSIKKLSLAFNNLVGSLPQEIGLLKSLSFLSIADNKLTDFGLARLFRETIADSSEQETSTSIAVKGTIGYAAPEYGIASVASPEGDVYSFGILLLEMFSGRRPTDDIFVDGLNLHNYVEMNLMENVNNIIDPILLSEEGIEDVEKCIASLFIIGLKCSESSPNNRMDLKNALRELQSIKDTVLDA